LWIVESLDEHVRVILSQRERWGQFEALACWDEDLDRLRCGGLTWTCVYQMTPTLSALHRFPLHWALVSSPILSHRCTNNQQGFQHSPWSAFLASSLELTKWSARANTPAKNVPNKWGRKTYIPVELEFLFLLFIYLFFIIWIFEIHLK
jgi:hypothetical protein